MKELTLIILAISVLFSTRFATASESEAQTILCQNLSAFYDLWQDSAFGADPNRTERAAWIVKNEEMGYEFLRWPYSHSSSRETWKGAIPRNVIALVHTHPKSADPKPSNNDLAIAAKIRVPLYVISRRAIWVAGPDGHSKRIVTRGWYKKLLSDCNSEVTSAVREPQHILESRIPCKRIMNFGS